MITIEGLTPYQKTLADTLWTMDTWDEIEFFVQGLHDAGRKDADIVLHMMTAATIDQVVDVAQSQEYLSKFRL